MRINTYDLDGVAIRASMNCSASTVYHIIVIIIIIIITISETSEAD